MPIVAVPGIEPESWPYESLPSTKLDRIVYFPNPNEGVGMGFDPKVFEAASRELIIRLVVLEALVELLIQKGVIAREEWDWRATVAREQAEDRMAMLEG